MGSTLLHDYDFTGLIREIKETAAELQPGGDNREKVIFFAHLVMLSQKVGKAVNLVFRDDDFADIGSLYRERSSLKSTNGQGAPRGNRRKVEHKDGREKNKI